MLLLLLLSKTELKRLEREGAFSPMASGRYWLKDLVQGYVRHMRKPDAPVSASELAVHFGCVRSYVAKLVEQGVIERRSDGKFDQDHTASRARRSPVQIEQRDAGMPTPTIDSEADDKAALTHKAHPVTLAELEGLARDHGLSLMHNGEASDVQGRPGVTCYRRRETELRRARLPSPCWQTTCRRST